MLQPGTELKALDAEALAEVEAMGALALRVRDQLELRAPLLARLLLAPDAFRRQSGTGADTLGERLGIAARWTFLIGAWGAIFSSLLGVWQSVPYLFADTLSEATLKEALAALAPSPGAVFARQPAAEHLVKVTLNVNGVINGQGSPAVARTGALAGSIGETSVALNNPEPLSERYVPGGRSSIATLPSAPAAGVTTTARGSWRWCACAGAAA